MADIDINGFRCHYDYRQYRPDAPTIVFCNGIMSMLESWDRQLPLLERLGYNCLRFEYRGQWRSSVTPGPYSFDLHAEDLALLLDELGIARAHLVGTSYGGFVSLRFAALYPERILSQMVLTSTAKIGPLARRIVGNWRALAHAGDTDSLYKAMIPDLYSPRFIETQGELIDARLTGMHKALRSAPDFLAGQVTLHDTSFLELLGEAGVARLSEVRCPTLVVAAELDRLYPPCCSAQIAQAIAGSQYAVVPDAGHALVVERPDMINLLLAGQLAQAQGDATQAPI